jgi:hypothetical protein
MKERFTGEKAEKNYDGKTERGNRIEEFLAFPIIFV